MSKKHFNRNLILGVSLSFILTSASYAANKVDLNDTSDTFLINNSLNILHNLNSEYEFKQTRVVKLPNKQERYKLTQYYKGVPVLNASIVSNKSSIKSISPSDYLAGQFIREIEQDIVSVKPALSSIQAITVAKNALGITNVKQIINPNIKLVIMVANDNIAKLVYLFDFFMNVDKPSRPNFIIDASNGDVLDSWEGLTTNDYTDATGPGGNEKTGKYIYGQDFKAMIAKQGQDACYLDSPNVATYDMNNMVFGGKLHSFTCGENSYKAINGAYSPLNDAHYFGNMVYDMYKDWFNTAPLTFKLKMRVHYDNGYENAFWDGSQMTFGDGKSRFYPLISLDVVAHEVSHGFTQQNSDLAYRNQSGGINEAFSDMAGEAAEYYMNLSKPESERVDWLVGGTIIKNGEALRYFADPTKDGNSIGNAKDYYNGLNVHYSSGVFNKAFYLLANTSGWNIEKAFRPFVIANQLYWSSSSTFDEGGCGVFKAAKDLDLTISDVINAFKEVGVDASCGATNPDPTPDPKPDPKPDPDPSEPDQYGAIKLKNMVPYSNISAAQGEIKLFYIDVVENKYSFSAWNYGGFVKPIMRVAYERLPSKADNDCTTEVAGKYRSCSFSKPKTGRYYIQLEAETDFDSVTLYSSYY